MPTFNPAYLLRDPSKKREVWEDMKKVRDFLNEIRSSQNESTSAKKPPKFMNDNLKLFQLNQFTKANFRRFARPKSAKAKSNTNAKSSRTTAAP
jgi:hypothetical protein